MLQIISIWNETLLSGLPNVKIIEVLKYLAGISMQLYFQLFMNILYAYGI